MERLQEKRGPRVGDAASLWNFAPAPGWTREEAQVLKLCLMQYGVGQWQAIHAAGHLPGKLIQQLYGQTQRLLGQQSLAAFTGLQVDVDRVRAENETRVQPGEPGTGSSGQNVQRKAGLIIYSGPPPSRELKEKWRRDARERYGLTPEQVKDVAAQLEELMRQGRQGLGADDAIGSPAVDVMTADVGAMDREAQLQLLARLSSRLATALAHFKRATGLGGASGSPEASGGGLMGGVGLLDGSGAVAGTSGGVLGQDGMGAGTSGRDPEEGGGGGGGGRGEGGGGGGRGGGGEGRGGGGGGVVPRRCTWTGGNAKRRRQTSVPAGGGGGGEGGGEGAVSKRGAKGSGGGAGAGRRGAKGGAGGRGGGGGGGKAGAKRRHGGSSDDDYGGDGGTSSGGGSDGGGEGRPPAAAARVSARKSAQQEALNAALAADIATLVDMGFSKGKARDALRACGDDVASACEWLFASCA